MKAIRLVPIMLLFTVTMASCLADGNARTGVHRENGWYHITPGTEDSISRRPIVAVKEFMNMRLDTNFLGRPFIKAHVCKHKAEAWADSTELAIGHRIGLVIDDSVITAPRVNSRIESGVFTIETYEGRGLTELYRRLLAEKRDTLMRICVHRYKDSPFWGLDLDQCDSLANTMDYHDDHRRSYKVIIGGR